MTKSNLYGPLQSGSAPGGVVRLTSDSKYILDSTLGPGSLREPPIVVVATVAGHC